MSRVEGSMTRYPWPARDLQPTRTSDHDFKACLINALSTQCSIGTQSQFYTPAAIMSDYEQARLVNIAANKALLSSLGIEPVRAPSLAARARSRPAGLPCSSGPDLYALFL